MSARGFKDWIKISTCAEHHSGRYPSEAVKLAWCGFHLMLDLLLNLQLLQGPFHRCCLQNSLNLSHSVRLLSNVCLLETCCNTQAPWYSLACSHRLTCFQSLQQIAHSGTHTLADFHSMCSSWHIPVALLFF